MRFVAFRLPAITARRMLEKMSSIHTKGKQMSKFTEWSEKSGVPVWVFFAVVAVVGLALAKLILF